MPIGINDTTFANEDKLPRLPVPSLISTAEQILDSLKPLVSPDDYQRLLDSSIDFLNSPIIKSTQQYLLKSAESSSCYLDGEGISTTSPGIYGELRGNTLPRNPFFILEDDPLSNTALPPTQTFRASVLVTSALRFILSLRLKTLTPDTSPKSNSPLSMNSYRNLFGTCRIPMGMGISVKKSDDFNDSRHIVVLAKSQFYKLEVINEDNKIWFTKHELMAILQNIIDDSKQNDLIDTTRHAIGSITTESKSTWKYGRLNLEKNNSENLNAIDTALFVLCLDDVSPKSDLEKVQYICHGTSKINEMGIQVGTCTSRWYDKLQMVVTKNSVAGIIWESTSMDGTSVLRFVSDVYTDSILRLARKINGMNYTLWPNTDTVPINDKITKPTYRKLNFNLTPEMEIGLHLAETRLADLINQHDYVTYHFEKFGKDFIMNRMKLSSDSFIQISTQIAFYALYGKLPSSNEPISTRKFKNARTETISIQSETVLKAAQAFITQTPKSVKWKLFQEAIDEHSTKVVNALNGKGFERHLSALRSAYIQKDLLHKLYPSVPEIDDTNQIPPLIFDPAIDALYKTELLIANCGNPALHMFGVTPATATGFGVGYIVKKDYISFVASSQWRQTQRFLDTIKSVMEEVKDCWKALTPSNQINLGESRARELEIPKITKDNINSKIGIDIQIGQLIKSIPMDLVESNYSSRIGTIKSDTPDYSNAQTPSQTSGPTTTTTTTTATQAGGSNAPTKPPLKASKSYIMGGYDYFDVGELALRSGLATATQSAVVSRNHSSTNLTDIAKKNITSQNSKKHGSESPIDSAVGKKVVIQNMI